MLYECCAGSEAKPLIQWKRSQKQRTQPCVPGMEQDTAPARCPATRHSEDKRLHTHTLSLTSSYPERNEVQRQRDDQPRGAKDGGGIGGPPLIQT